MAAEVGVFVVLEEIDGGGGDTEREPEREKGGGGRMRGQTDRDKQNDTETDRQTEKGTEREREREREGGRARQTDRDRERQRGMGGRQTDRQRGETKNFVCCLFSWLLNVPFHTLVYFRDGSAQTILRAATLRQKLQIKAFHLTQSQYTDTGPTSPRVDPITPGAWQGSHWNANV